ncbi:MAG TPA: hypothetical protein VFE36_14195 [Candidatus Baltobacteraceae bacterium]|nr:hypothetical protein [Candidatus Baltobacteraceae bacterium]HZZ00716.1 hypothetical protein [Candidatus Baltobacteraceae bacterium]
MAALIFTPGEERFDSKHHVEDELKAFLEAFALLETGMFPAELLKKIA